VIEAMWMMQFRMVVGKSIPELANAVSIPTLIKGGRTLHALRVRGDVFGVLSTLHVSFLTKQVTYKRRGYIGMGRAATLV
jgi:hypothetical protein